MHNRKKIFIASVLLSVVVHLFSVMGINLRSLWHTEYVTADLITSLEKGDKNEILKKAFSPSTEQKESKITPLKETASLLLNEKTLLENPTPPPLLAIQSAHTDAKESTLPVLSFPLPEIEPFNPFLSNQWNLETHLGVKEKATTTTLDVAPLAKRETIDLKLEEKKAFVDQLIPPINTYSSPVYSLPSHERPPYELFSVLPPLPKFPSLDELNTTSYTDEFDTEIVFAPLDNEEGYFFALTLIPHTEAKMPKLGQNYVFLIDKSNSIERERLNVTKHAVIKALEGLSVDDTFNIFAFDSKIDKLASSSLPAIPSSLRKAKEFLDNVELGSFFSPAILTKPLFLTVPLHDQDLHTAILLTDGDTLRKKGIQKELGLQWTNYNRGRVSLFSVGLGSDPSLDVLDVTCALNRGKMFHAPSERGLKRKLLKLMKMISHPIAKNMDIEWVSKSPDADITLYPRGSDQIPHLYLHQPYVILGKTKTLEPFTLFVQGKVNNRFLNIKRTISFENGKKGTFALKTEWALFQSHDLYHQYLKDFDSSHLTELHEILDPINKTVVFE